LDRSNWEGHLTGSGLVTNQSMDKVLLTLHAKLGLWLQLGGHADFDPDLGAVALRECQEESGLTNLRFVPNTASIFDLDIHWIPARKNEPGHWHYDVRFLFLANAGEPLTVSSESNDLKWFDLRDAYSLTTEISMHRQFDKLSEHRSTLL
jgi:8-oxo-dGTP pyrophosphatase MutT (NUDIX family)